MEAAERNGIYLEATRMNVHDLVRELNENVGATVVQTMAGVRDRTSPYKWAKPEGPAPRAEVEARLRLGYRVWKTVESVEGPSVALVWLMGSNPRLGEDVPALCIQEQRTREVIGAAEAFVNDTFAA